MKWQDFYTNDIRELTSRARNLTQKMTDWADIVNRWCLNQGFNGVAQALRLRSSPQPVRAIYLFGLSRTRSRTAGFGFTAPRPILAMANWPQLIRLRYRIGPVPDVFRELHRALLEEHQQPVVKRDIPVTVKVAGIPVRFENLWAAITDPRHPPADQQVPSPDPDNPSDSSAPPP